MPTERYYEAHITIDPVTGHKRKFIETTANTYGFRLAPLYIMQTGEEHKDDAFLSARNNSLSAMIGDVKGMCTVLLHHGIVIRRYKIEDTLLDSRIKDEFGLLGDKSD